MSGSVVPMEVRLTVGWVMVMVVSGGATGGEQNGNGACKLNSNDAALLCTIAKLVEKAKHNAHHNGAKDALGDVELHKAQLDAHKKDLEELLEEARKKGALTTEDVETLQAIAQEAQKKSDENHGQAKEVMKGFDDLHHRANESTKDALDQSRVAGNCHSTASILSILQCHVEGKTPDNSSATVHDLCKNETYHQDASLKALVTNCKKLGTWKNNYCSGTGAALKTAMEKWHGVGTNESASTKRTVGNCTVSNAWEKYILTARDHMLPVDNISEKVHHANDLSLAYFSTVWQIQEDVKNGKPMKDILANARKAGQKGAQVVVEKNGDTSPNTFHPTQGRKEEVQVSVQLDGLKLDDEQDPAHSKESFPKVYVYLLSIVLPLCCLVIGVTVYCILRRALSRASPSHPDDKGSMPVEAATLGKDGSTRVHF